MRFDPKNVTTHFSKPIQPQALGPGVLVPRIVGCPKCAHAVHFAVPVSAPLPDSWHMSVECFHCGHTFMTDALKAGSPSY